MDVLVTGSYGRCGTAIIDHLHDRYEFTYFNRSDRPDDHPYGGYDTVVGNVADYETLLEACRGQDAIVHLAAYPSTLGDWSDVFEPNILGTYHVLEAAREAEVESVIFGSTNHVMGMYERDLRPDLYEPGYGLVLDHTDPVRPDSFYAASKCFGEDMGRFYVETEAYPKRFYALRICTVNDAEYDHPYGNAEAAVEEDEVERGSEAYERKVRRLKATWQSRRDFAHQVECCLQDDSVEHEIFYGVSDNLRRWFDIEHARATIGYDPQDAAQEWDEPPA